MIAAWMLYASVIAFLIAIVAAATERSLRLMRLPARFAWLGAIVLVCFFAGAAAVNQRPTSTAVPVTLIEDRGARRVGSSSPSLDTRATEPGDRLFIGRGSTLARLDLPLAILWALASMVAISAVAASAIRLRMRRRAWRPEIVNGIPVHVSHDVGPAVSGILTYSIVMPEWVVSLDAQHRQLILAHEREHVRAADPALLFLGVLIIIAMPWNTGLWYIVRRLRMATEIDCDQRVLAVIPEPAAYADLLLEVSERALNNAIPIAALGERPSLLQERIETMTSHPPKSPRMKSALAGVAAAIVFVVACQTPRPYSTSSASERIPRLASELTSLMRNDSAMQALSMEDRAKVRSQLNEVLSETDGRFVLTRKQLDSLVNAYYPEIAASSPVGGALVAFVFDEKDSLIHHTLVPGLRDDPMDAVKRIGELFPDVKDRQVWTSGIADVGSGNKHTLGQGNPQTVVIWESFRDPNGAFAAKHQRRAQSR